MNNYDDDYFFLKQKQKQQLYQRLSNEFFFKYIKAQYDQIRGFGFYFVYFFIREMENVNKCLNTSIYSSFFNFLYYFSYYMKR